MHTETSAKYMTTWSRLARCTASALLAWAASVQAAPLREAEFWTFEQALALAEKGQTAPLQAALKESSDPAMAALAKARLAAGRLDHAAVLQELSTFQQSQDNPPTLRAQALVVEMDSAFAHADYAQAAQAAGEWLALPTGTDRIHAAAGVAQTASIANALKMVPRQSIITRNPKKVWTSREVAGLPQAPIVINSIPVKAVLDTGANLSVITQLQATRIGLRMLDASGSVGSASQQAVQVRLGIADRLEIGGVVFQNVAFLVMDDDQLKLPVNGGYQLAAIIGFPVFMELKRFTFGADDSFTVEAPMRASPPGPSNLVAGGNDLFVSTSINGIPLALHLDTGAAQTSLTARFAQLYPEAVKSLKSQTVHVAGAGGAKEQKSLILERANVTLEGKTIRLKPIDVEAPSEPADEKPFGAIGQDVLAKVGGYTIDLNAMKLTAHGRR
ncbi:aspartyl protease family protein [Roseateles sp. NT4]|uniref:aspartyl protease family protein n=1 Tax=Roseateles sp. NT4 TaxID=3453715 RepID=UPI003EEC9859